MLCEVITNNALTVETWVRMYWHTNICGVANHYRESSHQLIEVGKNDLELKSDLSFGAIFRPYLSLKYEPFFLCQKNWIKTPTSK